MSTTSKPGSKALRKGRHSQENGVYFITLTTRDRIARFSSFEPACVISRIIEDHAQQLNLKLYCWVVMPDHVHLLIGVGGHDLSHVMQRFKSASALKLNRAIGRKGPFWNPGFYDHGLRKEEDLRGISRYIVANPLRAKLVEKIGDYPYWNAIWL